MIRTQVYITNQEKKALVQIALQTGESQSELIRKAIDLLCQSAQFQATDRLKLLRSAKGIWKDRDEDDFTAIRNSMDRF